MSEAEFKALLAVEGKYLFVFKNGLSRWCAAVFPIGHDPNVDGMTLKQASHQYVNRYYAVQSLIKKHYDDRK